MVHELSGADGVIEADSVADLMQKRVAQVIGFEIAVEAHFPAAFRVEADQRLRDRLDVPRRCCIIEYIGESPPYRIDLRPNQNACGLAISDLAKFQFCYRLPHCERSRELALKGRALNARC